MTFNTATFLSCGFALNCFSLGTYLPGNNGVPFWKETAIWTGNKVDFVGHGGPLLFHKGPGFLLIKNCRRIPRRIFPGEAGGKRPRLP